MMKQLPTDKYTIAWFKLAECVSRGEREKALGVYRLLAHSLEDKAYAYQLEGDLLWAFGDYRAHERYALAAQSYCRENRMRQAAALYEHLHCLAPHEDSYLDHLAHAYDSLSAQESLGRALKKLYERALKRTDFNRAGEMLEQLLLIKESDQAALMAHHTRILISAIPAAHELIIKYLERALELLCGKSNSHQLAEFLTELEHLNSAYFKQAQRILNSTI